MIAWALAISFVIWGIVIWLYERNDNNNDREDA
jgi:hypothetical protein